MSTLPQSRCRGLATDLIQRSVALARCLGYKLAKTEATGDYSRLITVPCTVGDVFAEQGSKENYFFVSKNNFYVKKYLQV